MPQSTIYLRRKGYGSDIETVERVVRDIRNINGFEFGSYQRGTIQFCIRSESGKTEVWYTVPANFPLLREYELMLEEEE